MTTIDAFRSSVSAEMPPADVGPALQALWWALRGDLDAFYGRYRFPGWVQACCAIRPEWSFISTPPLWKKGGLAAFKKARVVVSAHSSEHAVRQAKTMIRALYGMEDPRIGRDLRSRARVWTPEGRWSSSDVDATDLAEAALFLAGPKSRRITGQAISVNGGISVG